MKDFEVGVAAVTRVMLHRRIELISDPYLAALSGSCGISYWKIIVHTFVNTISYTGFEWDEAFFKEAKWRPPIKQAVTIRLDADVLEWFRSHI